MNNRDVKKEMISVRDEYIDVIKAELLGPGSEFNIPDKEHELISSNPLSRYSIGILFPQKNLILHENDDTIDSNKEDSLFSLEDSEINSDIDDVQQDRSELSKQSKNHNTLDSESYDTLDEEISLATQFHASSMGFTFIAKGNVNELVCDLNFATYRRAKVEESVVPFTPIDPESFTIPNEFNHLILYDKVNNRLKLKSKTSQKEIRKIFEQDTIVLNQYNEFRNAVYKLVGYQRVGYVREPKTQKNIKLNFDEKNFVETEVLKTEDVNVKIVALRTEIDKNLFSITIMVVNGSDENPAKAENCIFQPQLLVESNNNDFIFGDTRLTLDDYLEEEEESLKLLYLEKRKYGTGLGVSVDWNINKEGEGVLFTDYFPVYEVPPMSFSLPQNDIFKDEELSMKYYSDLSESSKENQIQSLKNLVKLYDQWIATLETESEKLQEQLQLTAKRHIKECKKAAERMSQGIDALSENEEAYIAFQLANRAMFMQRIHIQEQEKLQRKEADRYPEDEEISNWLLNLDYREVDDSNSRWRPFQLAFILMDINSIINDESPDRDLVDLIWFPTGGGKTEAYLGLTAFTIFYRRLRHLERSDGTAIVMRYTLRLLASQQFTRAATLICACEYIRKDCISKKSKYNKYNLGDKEITIGLWIGGSHIPNKNTAGQDSAKHHLDRLSRCKKPYELKEAKERHNKFQVLKCPWCGTKMVKDNKSGAIKGEWGYAMKNNKHFYLFCPHEDCDFTTALPIQIIDEELYRNPPTLLFGTVDKFAMLPWDSNIGAFFATDDENRTPELIIQDELHLISGALGTMVGIYETAIDALASHQGVKPKIIASTATIRRAKEQCSVLYNREVVQFPAPGIRAEDSFFAREQKIDYAKSIYGRKYVGIMPSGKTKAMTEIRLIAALLQRAYMLDTPDEIKDKFWTTTVYFNNLKDLGKTSTLVEDDIKDFIIRTANRLFTRRRLIVSADELTSRITTTELNETLDKLEKIEFSEENLSNKKYASNILLATNMISVGIDVARLNVMHMVGQPKLTSEYIQASSRVGRTYPGVAFIQYDATRSRDRSHYEQFRPYHESFYRFVEPTGATPFSKPARDRALHAVFLTLLRHRASLSKEEDAVEIIGDYFDEAIQEVSNYIINRVEGINNRAARSTVNPSDVTKEIDEFIEYWQDLAASLNDEEKLFFGRKFIVKNPEGGSKRLLKPFNGSGKDYALETLTSMRNVDNSVTGSVIIWED